MESLFNSAKEVKECKETVWLILNEIISLVCNIQLANASALAGCISFHDRSSSLIVPQDNMRLSTSVPIPRYSIEFSLTFKLDSDLFEHSACAR